MTDYKNDFSKEYDRIGGSSIDSPAFDTANEWLEWLEGLTFVLKIRRHGNHWQYRVSTEDNDMTIGGLVYMMGKRNNIYKHKTIVTDSIGSYRREASAKRHGKRQLKYSRAILNMVIKHVGFGDPETSAMYEIAEYEL